MNKYLCENFTQNIHMNINYQNIFFDLYIL